MNEKSKNQQKRRPLTPIIAGMAAVILLGISVGAAAAYFTDGDTKDNQFTIGVNTITPDEEFDPVEPGKKTVKKPRAFNSGSVNCYVRAKVFLTDSRASSYLEYFHEDVPGFNTKEWRENSDGWLYYGEILPVGESSAPIFTHVKLREELPEEIADVSIDVVYESVQSDGFANAAKAFEAVEG